MDIIINYEKLLLLQLLENNETSPRIQLLLSIYILFDASFTSGCFFESLKYLMDNLSESCIIIKTNICW